jgi:heptosyltransferase-1
VTRSRELCAQALHYRVPDELSFGLEAEILPAELAEKDPAPGLRGAVALVHGTSRADKQWPLAHWRALAQRLNDNGLGVVLPHGSPAEQQTAHDIAQGLAHAQVWPSLKLDALTDALATCHGVIGVDSGLSHIAVALDLPHVQIYNFDTAWRTGPLPSTGPDLCGADFSLPRSTEVDPTKPRHAPRQCSVFAQPTPSVDTVWQAWLGVSATA